MAEVGDYRLGNRVIVGVDEPPCDKVRVAQVELYSNIMTMAGSIGGEKRLRYLGHESVSPASPYVGLMGHCGRPYAEARRLHQSAHVSVGPEERVCAIQDHAGMFDRVLDIRAVLYTLKDARRRTDDEYWTCQLMKSQGRQQRDIPGGGSSGTTSPTRSSKTNTSSHRQRWTIMPGAGTGASRDGRAVRAGPLGRGSGPDADSSHTTPEPQRKKVRQGDRIDVRKAVYTDSQKLQRTQRGSR